MKTPIKIDRARWWALSNPAAVFYGSLATHLVDVMDPSIDTACTDGKVIRWNPDFVEKLTDEEVRFVLLHEALHCAHAHFDRLPINEQGNIAGDYAINQILSGIAGISMPKGGLLDPKYKDMAEEEILAAIGRNPPQPPRGKPQPPQGGNGKGKPQQGAGNGNGGTGSPDPADAGGCGGFTHPASTPNPQGQTLREKWEQAVIQAEIVGKSLGRGDAPADLRRILDRVRATDVDWRREMAEFARTVVSERADWSRSTRRMATAPVIYPRRRRDRVGQIVVVRDTSGSIDKPLCDDFTAQISAITGDLGCKAVVLDVDTRIHAEYRLDAGEPCPLDVLGGGGTDFRPAFDRIAQLLDDGEDVAGVIYLTDLDGTFPDDVPDVPVLWAAYDTAAVAPIGRTIRVK